MGRYELVSDDRALELAQEVVEGLMDAGLSAREIVDFLDAIKSGMRLAIRIETLVKTARSEA